MTAPEGSDIRPRTVPVVWARAVHVTNVTVKANTTDSTRRWTRLFLISNTPLRQGDGSSGPAGYASAVCGGDKPDRVYTNLPLGSVARLRSEMARRPD